MKLNTCGTELRVSPKLLNYGNTLTLYKASKSQTGKEEQGRTRSYPSCVRMGRGSDGESHWGIWASALSSKR